MDRSMAVDASGNVYTIGNLSGTADFDPGPSSYTLTSAGGSDIFISKLDASGNFVWAKRFGGTDNESANTLALDATGNVYITGDFSGTFDVNPGEEGGELTAAGWKDAFISKLDASGNFVWAKRLGGTGSDYGVSVALDAAGNIYTAGYFTGTADFDPGADEFELSTSGFFLSKLDASGNFVWAKHMGSDFIQSITVDAAGNVYTTGFFWNTVDFDPGEEVFELTSVGGTDVSIRKLDASGNFVWAKRFGAHGDDHGQSVAVDVAGQVYTTGFFRGTVDFDPGDETVFELTPVGNFDGFISKLDASGNFVWAKQFEGTGGAAGNSVALDAAGNLYTTGGFLGTADFNPGADKYELISAGLNDIFISKLDATGDFRWAKRIGSTGSDDGKMLVVDAAGHVYTTGFFSNTVDFNPGAGISNLTSAEGYEWFVMKLTQLTGQVAVPTTPVCLGAATTLSVTASGGTTPYSYTWTAPNGATVSAPNSQTVSPTFTTPGVYSFTVTVTDSDENRYTTPVSVTINAAPTVSIAANPSLTIVQGQSTTLTASGADTYQWSTEQTTPVISVSVAGPYSVTGMTSGCSSTTTVNVTVISPATATLSGSTSLCPGQPATLSVALSGTQPWSLTYTDSTTPVHLSGITTSPHTFTVNPGSTTTYSLLGVATAQETVNGSVSGSAIVTVNAAPSVTITPSAMTVCAGTPVSLTASEGQSYLWNTGETTRVITGETTGPYSVTVTSAAGCSASATIHFTINPLPTVSIVANPSLTIVQGQSTTLTASGADSYTWSTTQSTEAISVTATGTYSVTGTTAGCSSTTAVSVTVLDPGSATLSGSTTLCVDQPATLSVNLTGTSPWSLTYTDGTTPVTLSGITTSPHTFTVNPAETATYTLLRVETADVATGGSLSGTATVSRIPTAPAPTLTPSNLSVIQNTPFVTLTITGCTNGLNWSATNGTSGTGSTVQVPTSATTTLVYSATCVSSCPTFPGSATLTVTAPTTTSNFDGFLNGADCGSFRGWAWDRGKPNTAFTVQILDGPNVIGTLLAGDFRQDLLDAGKGNGKHAFRFTIPDHLKDGLPHTLSARIAESSFILKDSPKTLICGGGITPPANKPPVAPSPTVLIAPLAAQVGIPFSGTLVAFTDPEGETLSYGLHGLPDGLEINTTTRVITGTPTLAGDFVLTYTATDPQLATNSVSFVLTVTAPQTTTVTGSFDGYLDKVECGTIRGWVWDRNKPNTPLSVEIYSKTSEGVETIWGSTLANIYRDDLKNAGKGNGVHAYSFTVPPGLKDGSTWILYGRVLGSSYALKNSGKPLTCNAPTRRSAETGRKLQVTVLGNPVSGPSIEVEIRGAEGQPLRLQLTDARGLIVSERWLERADTLERQRFEVDRQTSGFLFLQIRTPSQQRTIKILSHK